VRQLKNVKVCMDTNDMETPLAQSSVTMKLEEIQRRCNELMDEPDAMLELTLEEPPQADPYSNDPYNHHRS